MTKKFQQSEKYDQKTTLSLAKYYIEVLKLIGENPKRKGLLKTPERIANALLFLTRGYHEDPNEVIRSAIFYEKDYQQMILIKDMELYSLCEHHMLPFIGKVHVAYIPDKHITGLSKIPRVVNIFAHRLQVQERLTTQIKNCINDNLKPLGVAVVIEARHLCMSMRGVQSQHAITTTSDFVGAFEKKSTREELLDLIRKES